MKLHTLYRILQSSTHTSFEQHQGKTESPGEQWYQIPKKLRWVSFELDVIVDWVIGLHLVAGAGDPAMKSALGIFVSAWH
jgi:homogentisate 1,2-dioxygenase